MGFLSSICFMYQVPEHGGLITQGCPPFPPYVRHPPPRIPPPPLPLPPPPPSAYHLVFWWRRIVSHIS